MPSHSKLGGVMACSAGAYTASQAFTPVSPPQVTVLSRGTPSAQGVPADVPLRGSVSGAAYALSGTVLAVGAFQASTAVSKRRAKVRVMALPKDGAESAFTTGQEVTLLAPPAMAGRQGIIVEPHGDSFKVQLPSGAFFSFAKENMQAVAPLAPTQPATPAAAVPLPPAAAPSKEGIDFEFTRGQPVTILFPPALAGKQGTIVGTVSGVSFAVQLESGSVFNILAENLDDSSAPTPIQPSAATTTLAASAAAQHDEEPTQAPPAATAPAASAAAQDDEQLEFVPGQRVTILAPPALAGKKGSILGLARDESFGVQLDSGSVFHIQANAMQGAAAPAQPRAVGPAATSPNPAAAAQDDGDLVLSPGHRVTVLAPPALLGRRGAIVGPAWGDYFAVQLESGSVFNVALESLQDAITQEPLQRMPAAEAPKPALAQHGGEPELFAPGKQVAILTPPAVAGNRIAVAGPAVGETVDLQFQSGSAVATESIRDAQAPTPTPAAAAASPSLRPVSNVVDAHACRCEETDFEKGQVVEILAPPAAAGQQGTIGGHDSGDNWMVVLPSGNIFSVNAQNLKRSNAMVGAEIPSFENRSKKLSPRRSLRSSALRFISSFGRR